MSHGLILYLLVIPKMQSVGAAKEVILALRMDIDARVVISHGPMFTTLGKLQSIGSFLS